MFEVVVVVVIVLIVVVVVVVNVVDVSFNDVKNIFYISSRFRVSYFYKKECDDRTHTRKFSACASECTCARVPVRHNSLSS